MPSTITLLQLLQDSNWHHLFALARSHGLHVTNRWSKQDLVRAVHAHLLRPDLFPAIIPRLPPSVYEALRVLVQEPEGLPLVAFTRRYGQIQPYRPWRKDEADRKPWLTPANPASHLWFLGLLFLVPAKPKPGVTSRAYLPQELRPQLAPLFAPGAEEVGQRRAPGGDAVLERVGDNRVPSGSALRFLPRPGLPPDLSWHLALFLAHLASETVPLVKGRWLPPSALAWLATRTGLDQNPSFQLRRSERHMPYLAFLHGVAQRGGLIFTGECLHPTSLAWDWLDAAPEERWRQLWQAITQGNGPTTVRHGFPWPAVSSQGWSLLSNILSTLPVQEPLLLTDLISRLRSRDNVLWLGETDEELAHLLTGPLHWLGVLDVGLQVTGLEPTHQPPPIPLSLSYPLAHLNVAITPLGGWLLGVPGWQTAPAFSPVQPVRIYKTEPDTLLVGPDCHPIHLARLAPYCRWEPPQFPQVAQRFTLDRQKVAQAAAAGASTAQMVNDLRLALGRSPSRRQRQLLATWAADGRTVRLRRVVLLETDSAQRMGELRSRRHIRRHLGDALSPTRSEVNPAHLQALIQSLTTYGLPPALEAVSSPTDQPEKESGRSEDETPASGPASLLLTAALVFAGLGRHVELPERLSSALLHELAARLSPEQAQAARLHAQRVLEDVDAAIAGYLRLPAWRLTVAEPGVYRRIKQAMERQESLTIVYWNAERHEPIQRRITPYYFETRRDVRYVRAYCHLRQDERIFRLDRIEKIVDEES